MIYVQSSLLVVAKELDILYPSKKAIVKYIIYIHIETYFVDIEEMKKFILWHWKKSPQIMKYKRLGDMAITGVTNPFLFVFETWSIDRNWFLVLLKKNAVKSPELKGPREPTVSILLNSHVAKLPSKYLYFYL